jgi:hypothetical protein
VGGGAETRRKTRTKKTRGFLDLAQVLEGAVVRRAGALAAGALEALAAALEAGEGFSDEDSAEDSVLGGGIIPVEGRVLAADVSEIIFPRLGFGLAEAAEGSTWNR